MGINSINNFTEDRDLYYWLGKSTHAQMDFENVSCPDCELPHNDVGYWALHPHKTHLCLHCGVLFEGTQHAVSNHLSRPNKLSTVNKIVTGDNTPVN